MCKLSCLRNPEPSFLYLSTSNRSTIYSAQSKLLLTTQASTEEKKVYCTPLNNHSKVLTSRRFDSLWNLSRTNNYTVFDKYKSWF